MTLLVAADHCNGSTLQAAERKACNFQIDSLGETLHEGEMQNTQKKVVLVTGASRGLGKSIALKLAKSGNYKVYGTIYQSDLEEVPENLFLKHLDVTDQNACHQVVQEVLEVEGHIDVLINNAGQGLFGCAETVEADQAKRVFDINFFGPLYMTQAVLPSMRERKVGLIINISSVVAISPAPCWDLYNASKFALEGLSESLAVTLFPWNINVVLIEPPLIATEFVQVAPVAQRLKGEQNPYQKLMDNVLKRLKPGMGQSPDEIAQIVQNAIETDKPDFRYQTSDYVKETAAEKFVDPSGNKLINEDKQWIEKIWDNL